MKENLSEIYFCGCIIFYDNREKIAHVSNGKITYLKHDLSTFAKKYIEIKVDKYYSVAVETNEIGNESLLGWLPSDNSVLKNDFIPFDYEGNKDV